MVARGQIHWADLGEPWGRRPFCVVTRDPALPVLDAVTVAPLTRTIRGIASEVIVGDAEGLPARSAVSCDNLMTVSKALLDPDPAGRIAWMGVIELDHALRYALGIRF